MDKKLLLVGGAGIVAIALLGSGLSKKVVTTGGGGAVTGVTEPTPLSIIFPPTEPTEPTHYPDITYNYPEITFPEPAPIVFPESQVISPEMFFTPEPEPDPYTYIAPSPPPTEPKQDITEMLHHTYDIDLMRTKKETDPYVKPAYEDVEQELGQELGLTPSKKDITVSYLGQETPTQLTEPTKTPPKDLFSLFPKLPSLEKLQEMYPNIGG